MAIFSLSREQSRWLSLLSLSAAAVALLVTRPRDWLDDSDTPATTCLTNLARISRAVSLYERDYDEHLPRGVDPDDRFDPREWQNDQNAAEGRYFAQQSASTPFLHDILFPYTGSREVFHCPCDVGWETSKLFVDPNRPENSPGVQNVSPSSYAEFGTSYYYATMDGFDLLTPADFVNPSRSALLFDGDTWHGPSHSQLNCLFVDGHASMVGLSEFRADF